jgi:hypothetical protein
MERELLMEYLSEAVQDSINGDGDVGKAILARLDALRLRIVPADLLMQEITNESQRLGLE